MNLMELRINNHIVDIIHKHHITHVMEHSTSAPNERVLRTTQLAKLSFNHPSVVLTADVFQYFIKLVEPPLWWRFRGSFGCCCRFATTNGSSRYTSVCMSRYMEQQQALTRCKPRISILAEGAAVLICVSLFCVPLV